MEDMLRIAAGNVKAPKGQPQVSMLLPTRNASVTLEACLRSARSQHYSNIEVIVATRDARANVGNHLLKSDTKLYMLRVGLGGM